jgi:outer membrane protein OmpA-like peptidoglycan-associated protein
VYDFWVNTLTGLRLCEACPTQEIPWGDPEGDMGVAYVLHYDNMSFKLEGVFFETGKASLRKGSFKALDVLVEALKMNKSVVIELGGHTDSDGNDDSNRKLSQGRAESARAYLLKQGVSTGQVTAKGYGEKYPVVPNETKEGKAMNRRTQVKILSR